MQGGLAARERTEAVSPREEAILLARYLLGRASAPPAPPILDRYAEGSVRLFRDEDSPRDRALIAFVHRHPWSLPPLDAACALVRPQCSLRGRLILMLAILETTPEHAEHFIAEPRPRGVALLRLAVLGVSGTLKAALGLVILPLAGAGR